MTTTYLAPTVRCVRRTQPPRARLPTPTAPIAARGKHRSVTRAARPTRPRRPPSLKEVANKAASRTVAAPRTAGRRRLAETSTLWVCPRRAALDDNRKADAAAGPRPPRLATDHRRPPATADARPPYQDVPAVCRDADVPGPAPKAEVEEARPPLAPLVHMGPACPRPKTDRAAAPLPPGSDAPEPDVIGRSRRRPALQAVLMRKPCRTPGTKRHQDGLRQAE